MWQSDFIHWRLADGTDVEILNWLDDHSRYLLSCTAHEPVTGDDVVTVFLGLIAEYGPPASTLTDNGSVYTSRFTGGRNAFEYILPLLGVRQKNGAPGHPQTQARPSVSPDPAALLAARPTARTIAELQRRWKSSASTTTNTAPTEPSTVKRRRDLPRHPESRASEQRTRARALPPALRPTRHQRQNEPPPRRTDAPPPHRHRARPQTRPRVRRRRPGHVANSPPRSALPPPDRATKPTAQQMQSPPCQLSK